MYKKLHIPIKPLINVIIWNTKKFKYSPSSIKITLGMIKPMQMTVFTNTLNQTHAPIQTHAWKFIAKLISTQTLSTHPNNQCTPLSKKKKWTLNHTLTQIHTHKHYALFSFKFLFFLNTAGYKSGILLLDMLS